jgi:uncharacterized RDD family membrane protein YckC
MLRIIIKNHRVTPMIGYDVYKTVLQMAGRALPRPFLYIIIIIITITIIYYNFIIILPYFVLCVFPFFHSCSLCNWPLSC